MIEITNTVQTLTTDQAARVLADTLDRITPLPDPAQLRAMTTGLRDAIKGSAELDSYSEPSQMGDPDDLAKATLLYLADTHPDLAPIIAQAARLPEDSVRFDPATLTVGALVVLALQTEVKLTRNSQGKWSFTLHKHPTRDSSLGQLISKLISFCGQGGK